MPLTEPAGVYRPRHPERTVGYRLFEEHFERYVREYANRDEGSGADNVIAAARGRQYGRTLSRWGAHAVIQRNTPIL